MLGVGEVMCGSSYCVFFDPVLSGKNGQLMQLNCGLANHLEGKKKRPLERGLGHGWDTVFINNNRNDFKYLAEGDPGIECPHFASTMWICRRMDPI